jgi:hypothetical protein
VAHDLGLLAQAAIAVADSDDLLVFLDGDAFPVADWVPRARAWLSDFRLAAVRRDENLGDPQPAHLFCVTTAGFWHEQACDWAGGPTWVTTTGRATTDDGARLWRMLSERDIAWRPILRSNQVDLHPVWFGIYGGLVYHHGAAFRSSHACRWDAAQHANLPGPLGRAARWVRERATARLSERLADRILAGDELLHELQGVRPTIR